MDSSYFLITKKRWIMSGLKFIGGFRSSENERRPQQYIASEKTVETGFVLKSSHSRWVFGCLYLR